MLPTVLAVPRGLHPGAWWLWALALATAASRTTNPLLLGLLLAVAGHVVVARRTDAPWARAFVVFLKLGLVVVAIRVVAQVLLGHHGDGTTLATLPVLPLPDWAAGVEIGGPITAEASLAALVEGMRLATVLACIGAANALANPKRLLAAMPGALYEVGVAVVVALSFAPSLVASVSRIRAARRLRGRPDRGLRGMISVALPVLEDALERSLDLAAAMDSRGYGRQAPVAPAARRATAALILAGLLGVCVGLYGLLDGSGSPLLGLPAVVAGVVLALVGLHLAGRRASRTRYRPDPWAMPEWVTAGSGIVAAAAVIAGGVLDPMALVQPVAPLAWPALPLVPVAGLLVALLPAWLTPPPTLAPTRRVLTDRSAQPTKVPA
jgi:energy-coupling factor transport system permease protein